MRLSAAFASIAVVASWLSSSCPSTAPLPPLDLPEGCNPLLAGVDCFLPYPSDVFLVDDPA